MELWHDLFVASAGAAATLTGLIFVGVSINLTRILSLPTVPERALLALLFLLAILIFSLVMLIPQQSTIMQGIEITILSFIFWVGVVTIDIRVYSNTAKHFYRKYYFRNTILNQVATIPYIIGGIILLCGNTSGLYWIAFSFLFSIIKSIVDSWVLLVEINR
jgi:modulator of FtsH protease